MKKVFKGALSLVLLAGVMVKTPVSILAKEAPIPVAISEEAETYSTARGSYVEQCGVCNVGGIYMTMRTDSFFDHSELCQHGFTKGTDNVYKEEITFVYKCDTCGYGWSEHYTHDKVICEGYN